MVSLKWGDALSILLPGAVALFAAVPYSQTLQAWTAKPNEIGAVAGLVLLIAAALAGGVLEAWTRIAWERLWLRPHYKPAVDPLPLLRQGNNLELYERGVQSSYKYVTFYSNFAWATVLLLISHEQHAVKASSAVTLTLGSAVIILLRASHVQWTYYVNYVNKVFGPRSDDAKERPTPQHGDSVPAEDRKGDGLQPRDSGPGGGDTRQGGPAGGSV